VAIVNESAARALWPGTPSHSVVGSILETGDGQRTIVGVVPDIRPRPGDSATAGLYLPVTATEFPPSSSSLIAALRMSSGVVPDEVALDRWLDDRLGRQSARLEGELSEKIAPFVQKPLFQAVVFGGFASIALLLAAVGLYAVAAFDVARRRHEMGVRLTLGATGRDLRRLVIRAAVSPVLIGSTIGLLVTWWAAQFLQAFLFEVDARDPWTYGLVALTLVATAVVAAWLPARRAARTDPAMVLRSL
jgi:ABC-type antimicrobial peptide transport system permease subunit